MLIIKATKGHYKQYSHLGWSTISETFWFFSINNEVFLSSFLFLFFLQSNSSPVKKDYSASPGKTLMMKRPFSFGIRKGRINLWTTGWWDLSGISEGRQWLIRGMFMIISDDFSQQLLHVSEALSLMAAELSLNLRLYAAVINKYL